MSKVTLNRSRAKAVIDADCGAALEYLELDGKLIIKPLQLSYSKTFASAIMFPFANRVQNSSYSFKGKVYKLEKTKGFKTAIHGMVCNKRFKQVDIAENESEASFTYEPDSPDIGFPFNYQLNVRYQLLDLSLTIKLSINNKGQEEFPFAIGWHPYFFVENLKNTSLKLNATSRLAVNDEMMPTHIEPMHWSDFRSLDKTSFDDTFRTQANEIELKTAEYQLKISSTPVCKYVQLFTPPEKEFVAIEPMTAPANAFNNKMGLKTLNPTEDFKIEWKLELM